MRCIVCTQPRAGSCLTPGRGGLMILTSTLRIRRSSFSCTSGLSLTSRLASSSAPMSKSSCNRRQAVMVGVHQVVGGCCPTGAHKLVAQAPAHQAVLWCCDGSKDQATPVLHA
jgi:hypothetical protein